jgi:hypothetical protein
MDWWAEWNFEGSSKNMAKLTLRKNPNFSILRDEAEYRSDENVAFLSRRR